MILGIREENKYPSEKRVVLIPEHVEQLIKKGYTVLVQSSNKRIYSDEEYVNPLAVVTKKYPKFIFTMDSAFYYWNLTDVIPDKFCLATKQTSIRINEEDIKQYFVDDEIFEIGKTILKVENTEINIYNKERMLVELIRKKNQLPFDYYK